MCLFYLYFLCVALEGFHLVISPWFFSVAFGVGRLDKGHGWLSASGAAMKSKYSKIVM